MKKILIVNELGDAGVHLLEADNEIDFQILKSADEELLLQAVSDIDAIIVDGSMQVTEKIIQAAKKLRVIGRTGIRVRNIDLNAATRQGIIVINTPQANAVSAAEHTLALMLASCRRIPQANLAMAAGEHLSKRLHGIDLQGKTLGIVGLGAIGRLVAARAQAFDMQVIAVDPYVSELVGRELGVTLVDLDDLLRDSDIITLHTVVSEETIELINAETLSKTKDGLVLINISSARLIDPQAVADALRAGKLAGAAMDGPFGESLAENPLLGLEGAINTPSLATQSEDAIAAVSVEIVENTLAALRGTAYRNTVNMAWPAEADVALVQAYVQLAERIGALQFQLASEKIERVEIEVSGEAMRSMVRPMAAGLLSGLLKGYDLKQAINHINAPFIAKENGVHISQEYGIGEADYSNLITCRVQWRDDEGQIGKRSIAGVLFGSREPRIVQIDSFRIEAKPEGTILVMANKDVPGVIGQVATLLATYGVNIAEWRLGRSGPMEDALAFINLDGDPPSAVIDALRQAPQVTMAQIIKL